MEDELNGLQELLDRFNELNIKEREGPTFMEIARFPHWETVWSNILAFYLDPNEEHGLHDLMLKSISQAAGLDISVLGSSDIEVQTEYATEKGNRIDIVVFANNFILGIENKVNAPLDNELSDYAKTLDELAADGELDCYKLVLSKNPTKPTHGFISLRYTDLIQTLRHNIGAYTDYANSKYLLFLLDFMKNIQKQIDTGGMGDNKEVTEFLYANAEKVEKLLKYYNEFQKDLDRKLDDIDKLINRDSIVSIPEGVKTKARISGCGPGKPNARFNYQGDELIKYTLMVNGFMLFYQIHYDQFNLISVQYFRGKNSDQENLIGPKMAAIGIENHWFERGVSTEEVAERSMEEMKKLVVLLSKQKKR